MYVPTDPLARLSAIDLSPNRPQRMLDFIHSIGRQVSQHYQLHDSPQKHFHIELCL